MERRRGLKLLALFWDRSAAVACALIGATMLLVGWFSLSDRVEAGEQIPYIMSGGIGGLFVLSIGVTLWLSADLRDEWLKLDVIDETLRQLVEPTVPTEPALDLDSADHQALDEDGPRPAVFAVEGGDYALVADRRRASGRPAGRQQEHGGE